MVGNVDGFLPAHGVASQPFNLGLSTAAKIEATHSLLPRASNRLIPVGIPNPLLHNRLKSHVFTRTTP
jgi:hypothetical protein